MTSHLWLCVSLSFIGLRGTDGYQNRMFQKCVFNSSELKDMQYIESHSFNNVEYRRYDSRVGQWVGYTEFGVKNAERFNKDATVMAFMRSQPERTCKPNAEAFYPHVLSKMVKPYVRLASETPPGGGKHTHMLRCSSYSFYPNLILVTWLSDLRPLTSAVTSSTQLSDGDWYYQYHSYLEYTPRSGENISCMVEHPSLTEPLFVHWDDSMPETERNQVVLGASGLVLGLVLFLSGFIYYQRKKRGAVPVPTTDDDL